MAKENILIIGAGLCGSLLALRLGQRGYNVIVYEMRQDLRKVDISAGRSINLAFSDRGIKAMKMVGIEDKVDPLCIPMNGRMIHDKEGNTFLSNYSGRSHEYINSISRGQLTGLLMDEAEALPNVSIHFNHKCKRVDFEKTTATFYNYESKKEFIEDVEKVPSGRDKISVFPKPERMFPEGQKPKGGEYLNPKTGDVLTNKNVESASISITPEGKPKFDASPVEKEVVGSPTTKGSTQIKTNLFKKSAGWKWVDGPTEYKDIPTLVSVQNKGKHYYALEANFPEGVNLTRYADAPSEPRLRPTVKGFVDLGKQIGTISVRGKEHPVYDRIVNRYAGGSVIERNPYNYQARAI